MPSITQVILAYPSGGAAMAVSTRYFELVQFAHEFSVKTGARVVSIARRHDVCGFDCARLRQQRCEECGDPERVAALPIPIPEPLAYPDNSCRVCGSRYPQCSGGRTGQCNNAY